MAVSTLHGISQHECICKENYFEAFTVLRAIGSNWLTPPPPSVSDCHHMADPPFVIDVSIRLTLQPRFSVCQYLARPQL